MNVDLAPGPDLDTIDISKMDKGDTLEAIEEALKPQDDPEVQKLADEVNSEAEEPAEEPAEEEQPRNEKGQFEKKSEAKIPKSRFDEAVGKEREAREAAERRAAALEQQMQQAQAQRQMSADVEAMETKVAEMEKQYNQLLLDGEADKASDVMRQIRHMERAIATAEVENRTSQRTAQILESERMELAIAQLEAAHPILNPESESFDESLVNFVLAEQRRLMQTEGLAPSKAIAKAATTIVERYGPKAAPVEEQKGLSKAAEDRKAEAVKRNIEVSKAQPASMKETGMDTDKAGLTSSLPDVSKMTKDEYDALPDSMKAKLRGDFV